MRIMVLMPIIWWICLAALPAWAQTLTPGTECGAAGVGHQVGQADPVTKTAEQAAADRTRVAPDGWWTRCEEVPPPKLPEPCPGTGKPRTWTVGPYICTSEIRRNASPTDPSRDTGIADGGSTIWRQWTGPMRGHHWESCKAGHRAVISSLCAPATHCDTGWEHQGYKYRGAPVPIGGQVTLTKPGGASKSLSCEAGAVWRVK